MILRASRPPPTSSAPAPSAKSAGAPIPPLAGSPFAGAGAGAGAAFGGGGGGAAFGGGGGAALGGSGSHGALATTPPAFASITPSLHSASALAPPAVAVLALASATTAGSSWARAGEAASSATASIAASIINFLIFSPFSFRVPDSSVRDRPIQINLPAKLLRAGLSGRGRTIRAAPGARAGPSWASVVHKGPTGTTARLFSAGPAPRPRHI